MYYTEITLFCKSQDSSEDTKKILPFIAGEIFYKLKGFSLCTELRSNPIVGVRDGAKSLMQRITLR